MHMKAKITKDEIARLDEILPQLFCRVESSHDSNMSRNCRHGGSILTSMPSVSPP